VENKSELANTKELTTLMNISFLIRSLNFIRRYLKRIKGKKMSITETRQLPQGGKGILYHKG